MDEFASFQDNRNYPSVGGSGDRDLAISNRSTDISSKDTARNCASSHPGKHPAHTDQSLFPNLNLRCDLDILRSPDLPALPKRESSALHGERMSSSVQKISGLNRVIHEPARLILVALLSSVESA